MRRIDLLVVCILLAFAGFIVAQTLGARRGARSPVIVVERADEAPRSEEVVVTGGGLPAPKRNIESIRQRIRDHGGTTYIADLLLARDSSLARWTDRRDDPVRVWIDGRPELADFNPSFVAEVRRAFSAWGAAGVPLAFAFIADSTRAEVRVTFVDRFATTMSGRTLWERDANWWIVGGQIELSLRSGSGQLLTAPQFHAVALHEVGHLLGLDHTADTTAVMAPSIRRLELSPRDIATMRLIYGVPPGPIGSR